MTRKALPSPLTQVGCDCSGLPFMPLEATRLMDSDLVALSTGDEFKAAVLLWCKSWSQSPAASLPDDDRILARWTGYSLADWKAMRTMALRGWVKCSDGRLYHPIIADLAVKAHAKRKNQAVRANSRWSKERARKDQEKQPPESTHGTASGNATAMQGGRGKEEGTEDTPPVGGDARAKKARRCPADYIPGRAILESNAVLGFSPGEIEYELSMMKDHLYRDAHNDWDAAFRNWLRRAAKQKPRHDKPTAGQVKLFDVASAMRSAAVRSDAG